MSFMIGKRWCALIGEVMGLNRAYDLVNHKGICYRLRE